MLGQQFEQDLIKNIPKQVEKFFERQQLDMEAQYDTNVTLETAHAIKEKNAVFDTRAASQSERNNDYDPHGLLDPEISQNAASSGNQT